VTLRFKVMEVSLGGLPRRYGAICISLIDAIKRGIVLRYRKAAWRSTKPEGVGRGVPTISDVAVRFLADMHCS
jgi:hypothetical protein